jgi:acyl-CoA thioesterase
MAPDLDAAPVADADPSIEVDRPADFLADTDVVTDPGRPGRFGIEVSPAWNVIYTFGGMSFGLALRAAQRAMARDDLDVISAHAVYCQPVSAGPVVIDTRVLRQGRAAAQVLAELRPADSAEGVVAEEPPSISLSAVFGHLEDSPVDFTGIEFPADARSVAHSVTPPEVESSPFGHIRFHDQVEWRVAAAGFDPTAGLALEPGPAHTQVWMRFRRDPRLADGTIDPVALAVPADTLGWAVFRRMGATVPPFLVLTLELDLQVLAPTRSSWLLQDVRCQHAGGGFAFGTVELWDEDHRLVAMASQRARLKLFDAAGGPAELQG